MKTDMYVNDFLYFVVRTDKKDGKDVLNYCSGVNLSRYIPMLEGRLGLGSNPVLSGLQLVKYDLCALAHSRGAVPKKNRATECDSIARTRGSWWTEALIIEDASDLTAEEVIRFCVMGMVKRIAAVSLSDYRLPQELVSPEELQAHLEILCQPKVLVTV